MLTFNQSKSKVVIESTNLPRLYLCHISTFAVEITSMLHIASVQVTLIGQSWLTLKSKRQATFGDHVTNFLTKYRADVCTYCIGVWWANLSNPLCSICFNDWAGKIMHHVQIVHHRNKCNIMKKVHCSQVRFGYVQVTFEMEQEQRTCMHA